jgi:formylglycine-generating enzyme required for sulfatase activity/DNA-binding winged helix-turn-helix (wHTH) protein
MDHIVHRVLCFDSFALDLTRGCLRAGDRDIKLRPKTFEVLCYLAENSGRLVSKQELYEAVWPNVIVTDDSLVQCIRELRQKLGDDNHRLIKTVSRRGYLLDAAVQGQAPQSLSDWPTANLLEGPRENPTMLGGPQAVPRSTVTRKPSVWSAIAAAGLTVALGAVYLLGWAAPAANLLVASLAQKTPSALQLRRTFKDCEDCPEMVVLPPGEFMMGSPLDERYRQRIEGSPRHVVIARRIAIGRFEITVDQFSAFVTETGMTVGNTCRVIVEFDSSTAVFGRPEASFRHPGFDTTGSHPVVCISWHEAEAYAAWLGRRTGKPYRLPTEAEWEYAARADTQTSYSFGDDETELCTRARFADLDSRFGWRGSCRSDTPTYGPIQVGKLSPNPWGIFDMHGNAWEWVEDCWTPNASEIPTDGSPFLRPGKCEMGVIRGGSFASGPQRVRSATRFPMAVASHFQNNGFRVALSLGE